MKIYHIAFSKNGNVYGFIVNEQEVNRKISYYLGMNYKLIVKEEI